MIGTSPGTSPASVAPRFGDVVGILPSDVTRVEMGDLVARAISAIEQAGSAQEVRDYRDEAEALRAYYRSVGAGREAVNAATEIRSRCERRLGEALLEMEKAKGGRPPRGETCKPDLQVCRPPKLAEIGINREQAARYQQLAKVPSKVFEAAVAEGREAEEPLSTKGVLRVAAGDNHYAEDVGEKELLNGDAPVEEKVAALDNASKRGILTLAKAIRADTAEASRRSRIEKLADISAGNTPLEVGARYSVILADPPWRYENAPMGASSRAVENHYPTMSLEEICALPVPDIVKDDAILYLWATAPKLAECLKVLTAWGFDYRTNMVWVKDRMGMGYHVRGQHELLLIATRGNIPPPAVADRVSSVVNAPRGEHSVKPVVFYDLIESFYPSLPKIELFCRTPREGWAVWGNQSGRRMTMDDV